MLHIRTSIPWISFFCNMLHCESNSRVQCNFSPHNLQYWHGKKTEVLHCVSLCCIQIAVSHTLLCKGKSLTVVFLASSVDSSISLFNVHTCHPCQKFILPLLPLIIFIVFPASCLSCSLRSCFPKGFALQASVLQEDSAYQGLFTWLLPLRCRGVIYVGSKMEGMHRKVKTAISEGGKYKIK